MISFALIPQLAYIFVIKTSLIHSETFDFIDAILSGRLKFSPFIAIVYKIKQPMIMTATTYFYKSCFPWITTYI